MSDFFYLKKCLPMIIPSFITMTLSYIDKDINKKILDKLETKSGVLISEISMNSIHRRI